MNNLNIGDIVVVSFPEGHEHDGWNGCTFEVTYTGSGSLVKGKVIKPAPAESKKFVVMNQLGATIRWNRPDALKLATAICIKGENQDKYFSPFTGRWA